MGKAGDENRTHMASLEGCPPGVTKDGSDKDLDKPKNMGMPKSMPSAYENKTESEHTDAEAHAPDIAVLADLLTTLPASDRAGVIADLPQDQRLAIARVLAARIKENHR